jgi:hypothetical protein
MFGASKSQIVVIPKRSASQRLSVSESIRDF